MKAAARLQSVRDGWDERPAGLEDALLFNRKLWTVLATSATRPENPLPVEIKMNIGNIAVFIFSRTLELMTEPRPDKLNALISINTNIASGLRGSPA
jgi:flagellar protein FlaF